MAHFRTEWKYLCTDGQAEMLRSRLTGLLAFDSHSDGDGSYQVHSLYLDDYKDSCAAGNESGNGIRYKYRVRYYKTDPETLRFEQKEKHFDRGNKYSCSLSRADYQDMITGDPCDLFWRTEKPLLKRFCALSMMRHFVPRLIIDYRRTAFVEPAAHIRITLDRNITAGYEYPNFLNGSYLRIPMLREHQNIIEVKFDEILPGWIKRMIESLHIQQITYSKYYIGRKHLEELIR